MVVNATIEGDGERKPVAVNSGSVPATRAILEVQKLRKSYDVGGLSVEAVGDVSFHVDEGEFVCVVGPSGAGKTTLLKCIAGLIEPSSGRVELDGQQVLGPPDNLGLVFQDYSRSLLPWLTVSRNVTLPLRGRGLTRTEIGSRAQETLEAVGLTDVAARYPWQLSGGMQQRVAIARALAYRPEVLLMDEPFGSLDAQTRMDLEDQMQPIRDRFGVTVLFVTHDIDEAIYLGDRVLVLSGSPTHVAKVVHVGLARPRDQAVTKAEPRFGELRAEILVSIKASVRAVR